MQLETVIKNFCWSKFGTVYENSAKELQPKYLAIIQGMASEKDYKYIIDRLEHQATLYKISPWGLKFCFELLKENHANKAWLLSHIQILFEASNYDQQVARQLNFKSTKKDLEKYELLKSKLFDDDDFLKNFKLIKRNFWYIAILDYINYKKSMIDELQSLQDENIAKLANQLIKDIENPKQYQFG